MFYNASTGFDITVLSVTDAIVLEAIVDTKSFRINYSSYITFKFNSILQCLKNAPSHKYAYILIIEINDN